MYETLQCMAGGAILFVIAWLLVWANSGGNGANVPPEPQDNIIRSDVPGQPQYATQRAAETVNQRITGRQRDDDLHVYVSPDEADYHSQSRYINWMTENGRAESVGVHVHKVSAAERDRISSMRGPGSQVWHNTAETESGVHTQVTPPGAAGFGICGVIVALAILVIAAGLVLAMAYCAQNGGPMVCR